MAYQKTNWVNDSLPAINAENLNKIEDGIEKSYILKNLFSNNYMVLANLTYSNGTYTQQTADTSTNVSWKIQAFNNDSYVKTLNTLNSNELSRKSMNFTKDNTFNNINFGLNGLSKDSIIKINISDLEDGKTYTISWNLLNNVQGSIAWNEIQIEEGNNATSYSNFVGVIVESGSNDNGSWIKYSDGTLIQYGFDSYNPSSGTDYKIVTFPKSFANTSYYFSPSPTYNYYINVVMVTSSIEVTSVRVHVQKGIEEMDQVQPFMWFAIGRWK